MNHELYLCVYRLVQGENIECYRLCTSQSIGTPGSDPEVSDAIDAVFSSRYGKDWEAVFYRRGLCFTICVGDSVQTEKSINEYTDWHMFNNMASYNRSWE
jgi:hypothetical protein